ncbi:NEL domain-containing protein [Endozoicomonas sp. SCSIO W0465]|uniref:NEL domain-containing protein n=1 Tax=Endozoicomonas sp. SCSIO W0465 TaxID=2918516 RepID=UPI002075824A|nr:NEL domain-containing protein [Endozoicomonas sp. SCSIO W0465]USE37115.1 NEL domain-containing protein [Endozoicomonas sp. SCSIO W0465]
MQNLIPTNNTISSESSPIAGASSNAADNEVGGQNHTPQSQIASYSTEIKPLADRSALETKSITPDEMKEQILQQDYSNDVHYQVEGNLYLASCCSRSRPLPKHLFVSGHLNLVGSHGLTALPEYLSVGGDLDLGACSRLTALPENLFVGGNLFLDNCTGLTTLPNWITTLRQTSQGTTRSIHLENAGLSDTLIDRLRTTTQPGIQFHFSRNAGQPEKLFSNMEQGFAFWRDLASSDLEMPELDLRHDQATELVHYLSRLTSTADYQNRVTRPVLAQRVMALMSLLTVNERVREDALRHINQALSSCDDRIILALDDLETLQLRHSAEKLALENRDPQELRALGLKMMHLDEVKRIARDHMKSLSWVDEVEVVLAFQIGVRQKKLDLPGSTQHMLFRGCAYVSDQDIANAVQQVNTHCSGAKLEAYLLQWAPWQKFQRLQAVPFFDQLPPKTVARIDNCIICTEKTGEMVALADTHLDYNTLVKAYMENGKNPLTNTPLDWSSVFRLLEEKESQ